MNLPFINSLNTDGQSTYITFSKSLLDFDKAVHNGTKYVFTKMVALNLPNWQNPDFFFELNQDNHISTNPNVVIPELISKYMENICREDLGIVNTTEIGFWKLLKKCGLSSQQIKDCVVSVNDIALSNFIFSENNNGWSELIGQIPINCLKLNNAWKKLNQIPDILQSNYIDGMTDNGYRQFIFSDSKDIIDFNNITYDDTEKSEFNFNVLLLFYIDDDNVQKLHGINFIHNFENKVTHYETPRYKQLTNNPRSIGYQFKFNIKTCNNEATQIYVHENNEHVCWDTFGETLSKLNSFLDLKMKEIK